MLLLDWIQSKIDHNIHFLEPMVRKIVLNQGQQVFSFSGLNKIRYICYVT